jgi:hypothetical protein
LLSALHDRQQRSRMRVPLCRCRLAFEQADYPRSRKTRRFHAATSPLCPSGLPRPRSRKVHGAVAAFNSWRRSVTGSRHLSPHSLGWPIQQVFRLPLTRSPARLAVPRCQRRATGP